MAKVKKQSLLMAVVSSVLSVLTIFPLFLNLIKSTTTVNILGNVSKSVSYEKLSTTMFNDTDYQALFTWNKIMIIAAVVLAGLMIVCAVLMVLKMNVKKCILGLGVLLFVVGVVSIILGATLCSKISGNASFIVGSGSVKFAPAVGFYLGWVGALLGGVSGVVTGLK